MILKSKPSLEGAYTSTTAGGCYDRHSISACQDKYEVLVFTQNERHHGMGQRRNLCMNRICAVHSGKILPGSVWWYVRKQSSQRLKGCKIYLLAIFIFLFHFTKPGILLHYLFWGLSYWDPERILHHLSLSHHLCPTGAEQHWSWWHPALWLL